MCIIFYGDNMNDEYFMRLALKEAKKALIQDEIPVGAVIVKDNRVIARGYNKRNKTNIITDHAEIIAINKANKKLVNWRLEDCDIYITLEPCPMCASAIEQSRFKRIITGANNNNTDTSIIVEKILKKDNWQKDVLKDECSKIINDFFIGKRK